jgi:hypothetical protein
MSQAKKFRSTDICARNTNVSAYMSGKSYEFERDGLMILARWTLSRSGLLRSITGAVLVAYSRKATANQDKGAFTGPSTPASAALS